MKVAIVCVKGLNSFTRGIASVLARKHEVREYVVATGPEVAAAEAWADVVWCEWANELAALLSTQGKKPLVVRMHRYEAWSGLVEKVDWKRVRALIVTSRHVLMRASELVPTLTTGTRCVVIPSGIDLDLWPQQRHDGSQRRIGVVSYVHGRKQPGLWLQVLALLPEDFHLHQIGAVQQPEFVPYLREMAGRLGLADRFHMEGHLDADKVAAWWKDKDWCLSTSMDEGCPYNVIEAAALGVLPVVHEYVGAREQFPVEWLWTFPWQAAQTINPPDVSFVGPWDCGEYRPKPLNQWAMNPRFSLDAQAPALLDVVEQAAR